MRLKKGLASRYWEDLLLAVVGEQLDVGDEVCGLVVSVRYQEDIISVWNHSCNNAGAKQKIQYGAQSITPTHRLSAYAHIATRVSDVALFPPTSDTMRRVLSLPAGTVMEYKNHDASIKDNSSFRNTEQHSGPYRPPARRERERDRETFGEVDSLRTSV